MADITLSSIAGGSGLPRPTSLTKKQLAGRVTGTGSAIASLASAQALQTVLDITTPIAIGTLHVDAGGNAETIDRIIITSDKGVLYDGDSTVLLNGSAWFLGIQELITNASTVSWSLSNQSFRMESLKIELETTSSGSTVFVYGDLELIE